MPAGDHGLRPGWGSAAGMSCSTCGPAARWRGRSPPRGRCSTRRGAGTDGIASDGSPDRVRPHQMHPGGGVPSRTRERISTGVGAAQEWEHTISPSYQRVPVGARRCGVALRHGVVRKAPRGTTPAPRRPATGGLRGVDPAGPADGRYVRPAPVTGRPPWLPGRANGRYRPTGSRPRADPRCPDRRDAAVK